MNFITAAGCEKNIATVSKIKTKPWISAKKVHDERD